MLVYVARRGGLTGCVGVCCQERGIDRVCWCMLPGERDRQGVLVYVAWREGLTGRCDGVCCQERGIDRVCWCMLPGERD